MKTNRSENRIKALTQRAEKLLKQPKALVKELHSAQDKLARTQNHRLTEIKEQLAVLIAWTHDILSGAYKDYETKTPVMIIVGILYFLMPLDSIPDFLLGWGYIDDVAVISFIYRQLRTEVEHYLSWRQRQKETNEDGQSTDHSGDL